MNARRVLRRMSRWAWVGFTVSACLSPVWSDDTSSDRKLAGSLTFRKGTEIKQPGFETTRIVYSPNSELVAVAGRAASGAEIRVLSVKDGRQRYSLRLPEEPFWLGFVPSSGDILYATGRSQGLAVVIVGSIGIVDAGTGKLKREWRSLAGINSVAVAPDGKSIALGVFGNKIRILPMESLYQGDDDVATLLNKVQGRKPMQPEIQFIHNDNDKAGWPTSLVFSPNADWLASISQDLGFWSGVRARPEFRFRKAGIGSVTFSPDGTHALFSVVPSANNECKELVMMRLKDGVETTRIGVDGKTLRNFTFLPDGKYIVASVEVPARTASQVVENLAILTIDVSSKAPQAKIAMRVKEPAVVSPDGKIMITGGRQSSLIFWDVVRRR